MSPDLRPLSTRLAAAALAALSIVALSACSSSAPVAPSPRASSSAAATTPATTGPTPTAPALVSTPYDADCSTLLDVSSLAAFYPGLAVVDAATPDDGSSLAQVVESDGTLCSWRDTAGETVTVGIARYDDDSLTSLANDLVATSNSVPTFGVEGYFDEADGVGTAEAFSAPYFVVTESSTFVEPGDAEPVVADVISATAG